MLIFSLKKFLKNTKELLAKHFKTDQQIKLLYKKVFLNLKIKIILYLI